MHAPGRLRQLKLYSSDISVVMLTAAIKHAEKNSWALTEREQAEVLGNALANMLEDLQEELKARFPEFSRGMN